VTTGFLAALGSRCRVRAISWAGSGRRGTSWVAAIYPGTVLSGLPTG
jgi:hypothetical protein